MAKTKKTLEQLLRWAKTRCYIEICIDGSASVQMFRDDYETRYSGDTLYQALLNAYQNEVNND